MYHQERLNKLERVLTEEANQKLLIQLVREEVPEFEGLILSGSLVEGKATTTSDIDLIIIVNDENIQNGSKLGHRSLLFQDNLIVDLDVRHFKSVIEIIDCFDNLEEKDAVKSAWALPKSHFDLIHRLTSGVKLVCSKKLDTKISNFDPKGLSCLLFNKNLSYLNSVHIDLIGSILSEDKLTQNHLSRRLIEHLIDLVNSAFGNTNPSEKWRYRIFLENESLYDDNSNNVLYIVLKIFRRELFEDDWRIANIIPKRVSSMTNLFVPLLSRFMKNDLMNNQKWDVDNLSSAKFGLSATSIFRNHECFIEVVNYNSGGSVEIGVDYFFSLVNQLSLHDIRKVLKSDYDNSYERKVIESAAHLEFLELS